jgi:hypothetical protein
VREFWGFGFSCGATTRRKEACRTACSYCDPAGHATRMDQTILDRCQALRDQLKDVARGKVPPCRTSPNRESPPRRRHRASGGRLAKRSARGLNRVRRTPLHLVPAERRSSHKRPYANRPNRSVWPLVVLLSRSLYSCIPFAIFLHNALP